MSVLASVGDLVIIGGAVAGAFCAFAMLCDLCDAAVERFMRGQR